MFGEFCAESQGLRSNALKTTATAMLARTMEIIYVTKPGMLEVSGREGFRSAGKFPRSEAVNDDAISRIRVVFRHSRWHKTCSGDATNGDWSRGT